MNTEELLGQKVGDMTKSGYFPEGVYHVRIAKAELKEPEHEYKQNPDGTPNLNEPNYPYINYDYVLCGSSPEELHGRHVFEVGTLKPGATFVNRQVLTAVGHDDDTTLAEALPTLPDSELLIAVSIDGKYNKKTGEWEGQKGKDGKFYEPRNKVTKRMALDA